MRVLVEQRRIRIAVLAAIALFAGACGGPTGPIPSSADPSGNGSMMRLDLDAIAQVEEISLSGLVNAEVRLREGVRESTRVREILEEASPGFWERFDADLADHGWSRLVDLSDAAGIGPLAASGLTASLGDVRGVPVADWGGSLQAVSGNFTLSMFMAMMVREWQRLSGSDWSAEGEFPPDIHDRVEDGVAEHSEIRTTLSGSASADQLRFQIQVVSKATLTAVSSGEIVATYQATGRGVIEAKGCPDAKGVAEGHYTLELEEQAGGSGGAAAGGSTKIDGPFRMADGDDAHLIRTDFDGRFDSAGNGTGPSGGDPIDWSVQSTYPISIPASGGINVDESSATYQETGAPGDRGQRATTSLVLITAQFISGVAQEAERFWRSGKCVDLTTSEESRKVEPSEEVRFDVTATHHFDHEEIEAPVMAEFSGTDSIDPSSGALVDPPASFTHTAGSEPGDKGTIELEQRSNRGIGRKTLEFEVEEQKLIMSLDGRYELDFGEARIDVHFVITELPLIRGDDEVFRGSGTGTVVGSSVLSGNCTGAVDGPVTLRVEGRVKPTDPELIRIVFPVESIGGQGTEVCAGMSVSFPATAAVGALLASVGLREIPIGETTRFQAPIPEGSIYGTVTVVRDDS